MSQLNEQFTEAVKKLSVNLQRTKDRIQAKFDEVDTVLQAHQEKIHAIQAKIASTQDNKYEDIFNTMNERITELENMIATMQKDIVSLKKENNELSANLRSVDSVKTVTTSKQSIPSTNMGSIPSVPSEKEVRKTQGGVPPIPSKTVPAPSSSTMKDIPTPKSSGGSPPTPKKKEEFDMMDVPAPKSTNIEKMMTKQDTDLISTIKGTESEPKKESSFAIPEAPKSKYDEPQTTLNRPKPVIPTTPSKSGTKKLSEKDEYLEVLKKLDSI